MSTFLITYGRGPRWHEVADPHEAPLPQHLAFAVQQQLHGMLLLAGTLPGQRGAVAVLQAENEDAARDLILQDPAVVSGHFQLDSVQPFSLMVGPEGGVS